MRERGLALLQFLDRDSRASTHKHNAGHEESALLSAVWLAGGSEGEPVRRRVTRAKEREGTGPRSFLLGCASVTILARY